MTRYTKSKLLLAGLFTAAGLLMAGCGGGYAGGSDEVASTSTPGTSTPGTSVPAEPNCDGVQIGSRQKVTLQWLPALNFSGVRQVAWDGTNYWFLVFGGGAGASALVSMDSAFGNPQTYQQVVQDIRSIFAAGPYLYASVFADSQIWTTVSPGKFAPAATLDGADDDRMATWDSTNFRFVARNGSTVSLWTGQGTALESITLANAPAGRGIAVYNGLFVTWDGQNQELAVWHGDGTKAKSCLIPDGGTSSFLSMANGQLFIGGDDSNSLEFNQYSFSMAP